MDVLTLTTGTHSYELPAATNTAVLGTEIAAAAQSGGGMVNVTTTNARGLSVIITPGRFVAIQLKPRRMFSHSRATISVCRT
jgi:hypothetical protein